MVIDKILDRKDGKVYNPKAFYDDVTAYGDIADAIAEAMDGGEEQDVKRALNIYIVANDYNPEICTFVNSVQWLSDRVVGNCEHCGENYTLEAIVDGDQVIVCPHCHKESDNWDTPDSPQMAPGVIRLI